MATDGGTKIIKYTSPKHPMLLEHHPGFLFGNQKGLFSRDKLGIWVSRRLHVGFTHTGCWLVTRTTACILESQTQTLINHSQAMMFHKDFHQNYSTLPKTNSKSPLKIGLLPPKGYDFKSSGGKLVVSGRIYRHRPQTRWEYSNPAQPPQGKTTYSAPKEWNSSTDQIQLLEFKWLASFL